MSLVASEPAAAGIVIADVAGVVPAAGDWPMGMSAMSW